VPEGPDLTRNIFPGTGKRCPARRADRSAGRRKTLHFRGFRHGNGQSD